MGESPVFSIIIPFKTWSPYLDECLPYIRVLSFRAYEVILLPDDALKLPEAYRDLAIDVIPTGEVNPAIKRDIGAGRSRGEFLAFIDDDAFPQADWLDVAYRYLTTHKDVGAIGGPAITPPHDPYWARVSGAVFLSRASGGFPERYVPRPPGRMVDDWPTVNLLVRKDLFLRIGGFDSKYWPGEDTLFCLKVLATGTKIFYVPELKVWHHRREGLKKHLRQIGNYGLHRGFFAKKFPKTSRRFKYFIPSLWMAFVLGGLIPAMVFPWVGTGYWAGWAAYLLALAASWKGICAYEPVAVAFGAIPYIAMTHLWYGMKFIQGLSIKELKSTLGR